jgi:quercetin dioxygenase-like cupin family protein
MLTSIPLVNLGNIRGIIYDFSVTGDVLPMHVHTVDNIHITIVSRGSIRAYSHDWSQTATAGQVVDFRVGEPHEICALEDNTRIINIQK